MKKAMLVALLSVAAIAAADAKVHIVSKGGLKADERKLLDEQSKGEWMQGCVVRGVYQSDVTEEGCDLLRASGSNAVWMWVKP